MTAPTPPHPRHDLDRSGTPAWYDDPTTRHHAVTEPTPHPAAGPARRTVSARVAAVIGVVAFLLGAGVSMLTGPLLGGGPGGPGGPGGAPGTSQQQSGTGSATSGTGSSGTGSGTSSSTTGT